MADDPTSTYGELISLLDQHRVAYALIDHAPCGATDAVSELRGHPLAQAAKCLLLMVKIDKRTRTYVLAVVPGDRSVDLAAVRQHYRARYAGFCDAETAERLAHTVPGTVLPFAVDPDVELIVDPAVLDQPRLYFNAARLDRSISLSADDYARVAQPHVVAIAGATVDGGAATG